MKYLKLLKAHLLYLLNKRNIIILSILNLISFIYILISSSIFEGFYLLDLNRSYYYQLYIETSCLYIKVYYIFFVAFINIPFFSGAYSKYSKYIIKDNRSKWDFYLSKYISIIIFDLIELIFLFLCFFFVLLLTPYYKDIAYTFRFYIILFFEGLFYLFLSSFFLLLTKSYLSGFLTILISWIAIIFEEGIDNKEFKLVISILLPSVQSAGDYFYLPHGLLHLVLMILIVISMNVVVIVKSDSL